MNFTEGEDLDWTKAQLNDFVDKTEPVTHSIDVAGVWSAPCTEPACGRDEAIRMAEATIGPILEKLSPGWRTYDTTGTQDDEFWVMREASKRLLARINDNGETQRRLASFDAAPSISVSGMHPKVWEAAKTQWNLGQHVVAVDHVAKMVNSMLQQKVGRNDVSEGELFQQAFSQNDPQEGKSRLRFPDEPTTKSQDSKARGVMQFGEGCFAAIRNLISHTPNSEIAMERPEALECLAAFSLLARWIDEAKRVDAEPTSTQHGKPT